MFFFFFFLMIRRPPRSTQSRSSAASDVYKRQHTDEVYFRDTAHGFLAWAVALVITAAFLAAAAASMVGATASSAAGVTGRATGVQAEGREFDPNEYFIDTLFRSESAKPDSNS